MEFGLLLRWCLVLAGLTALGAPLSALLFERLAWKGAPFSLPVTLLVWTTVVFLLGQATFGYHTLAIGGLVVAVLSGVSYYRGYEPDWRAVAGSYGVFLFGFLLYVVYASHNAAITPLGGEQFLHYGLTNTIVHAESLPPEDFWFAGEEMRYYYGTQLQVALLSMVTGTELRFGFYLGLATFYGLLFVSAYGLGGALLASRDRSYHLGGILAACFTAVGGTLVTTVRLGFRQLPQDVAAEYGRPAYAGLLEERGLPFSDAYNQGELSEWFWFYDRYVIEGALNEFPFYSFIKADLHGHSLSTGYIVVAGAIAFSYAQTPQDQRGKRLGIMYGGLGLVAGVFGFMNTWSLPTAIGLAWLALAAGDAHPATLLPQRISAPLQLFAGRESLSRTVGAELWRVVLAAAFAVPVAVVGIAIASPFLVFNSIPTNEGIGLFPPQTSLPSFLVMYGGILTVFVVYLAVAARSTDSLSSRHLGAGGALLLVGGVCYALNFTVGALLIPILAVAWWAVRTERDGFIGVLLIAGFGLLLSMEVVHARVYPFDRVRWNTTLKVAVQGWTLAAVGAGAASAVLLSWAGERLSGLRTSVTTLGNSESDRSPAKTAIPAVLVIFVVCLVVLSSLPFAGLTLYNYVGEDVFSPNDGSVDALDVHDQYKGAQMEALYWLQEKSQPTIVEAPARRSYQWRSVASVFTDAVTVAGWDHQEGYRGANAFDERATDVENLYTGSPETIRDTVQKYGVEYIYVGPSEREAFTGLSEFDQIAGIEVAFQNNEVTIYEVSDELRA